MHSRPLTSFVPLLSSVAGLLASTAGAQSIVVLVKDADLVTGVGGITTIDNLAVNNAGTWMVESDTDDPNTVTDSVILRGGVLYVREGDPLALPVGASVGSFDALSINSAGNTGWNLFLDGLTTTTDSGVFFGTTLVIQEGALSTAPQFSANTPYTGWFEARLNDNNQIMMLSSVDDPAIASTTDRALVIATVSGTGVLLSEFVVSKEGDVLPGSAGTLTDVGTGPHNIAFNNLGRMMFVADTTDATTVDGFIVIGDTSGLTVVAREGDPSPIGGRNYETLASKAVDLNDVGDWVHTANLDGATTDDEVIVKNGTQIIAQEGTVPPGITGFTLTGFGSGAVRIDNSGNVYWFGDWNDPDLTRDTGIFKNNQLIVQEGVTLVGGVPIATISGVESNFSISPDGRYLIFEGRTTGTVDAAFLIDFGGAAPQPFCFGDGSGTACPCGNSGAAGNGCANSINAAGANLSASGTSSISSDTLVLTATGMNDGPGLYFQGTTRVNAGSGAVFGDGLRCAGGSVVRLKIVFASGGTSSYPQGGDPSISVKGMVTSPGTRTYQLWYRNAGPFCTTDTFNLTNGVEVTWN